MIVRENIEIIFCIKKINEENIKKRIYEFMEMVGLNSDEYLDCYFIELSGGQQQRIGVVRVFVINFEIILMDEFFSVFDLIICI